MIDLLWKSRVGARATVLIARQQDSNPIKLAPPSDIAKLSTYIKEQLLNCEPPGAYNSYRRAIVLVEARLAIFNRRRPIDIQHIR
jgi:hypothetical protein